MTKKVLAIGISLCLFMGSSACAQQGSSPVSQEGSSTIPAGISAASNSLGHMAQSEGEPYSSAATRPDTQQDTITIAQVLERDGFTLDRIANIQLSANPAGSSVTVTAPGDIQAAWDTLSKLRVTPEGAGQVGINDDTSIEVDIQFSNPNYATHVVWCGPVVIHGSEFYTFAEGFSEQALYDLLSELIDPKPLFPDRRGLTQGQAATESHATATSPAGSIEFYGKTYLISEADYTDCDQDGAVTFVLFENIGFIGLEGTQGEILYQQVRAGQEIGGAVVAEGTNMGFDYINGVWELTESDVRFTGPVQFTGELTKTPESEWGPFPPGMLTFTAISSENGFMPYKYGDDGKPQFILHGYDPEADYPGLFSESNTVYVNATFDDFRILKTGRATGMNFATIARIDCIGKNG